MISFSSFSGILVLAVLLPIAIILAAVAITRAGPARTLRLASAGIFLTLAAWFLVFAFVRLVRAGLEPLLLVELILAAGFLLQGLWIAKAAGKPE